MSKHIQGLFPKLSLAWAISMFLSPFVLFSGIFINLYQLKLKGLIKYLPVLVGSGLLYLVSPQLSLIYLSLSSLIAVFNLFFKKGFSLFYSGFFAVTLISSVFFIISFYFFTQGQLSWALIQNSLQEPITKLIEAGVFKQDLAMSSLQLNILAYQAPSLIVILLMFSLFITVIYEKSSLRWLGFSEGLKGRLSYFKLPDPVIWLLILSLAGGYVDLKSEMIKIIALNLLNISVVCYFFQGFAVLFNFFEVFRVGLFTKFIMILCFVIQLSFVTVVIGVLDYWFNFRGRFIKKATQVKERSGL